MIKAIFAQKASHNGICGPRLMGALMWWIMTIENGISECRPWAFSEAPPARLFVDAASTPARLAGVLFCDGRVRYFDGAPSQSTMEQLANRDDGQITSLVCSARLCARTAHARCTLSGDYGDHGRLVHLLRCTGRTQRCSLRRQQRCRRSHLEGLGESTLHAWPCSCAVT